MSQRMGLDLVTEQQQQISEIVSIEPCCCCCLVASVVSDSVRPHRWQPSRLLHPWDSPGKSTGVGCHCLLQNYVTMIQNMKDKERERQNIPYKILRINKQWIFYSIYLVGILKKGDPWYIIQMQLLF